MNEYIEKLVADCFKGIRAGLSDNDKKKVWRSYFKLKEVLSVVQPDQSNDEVVID